MHVYVQKSTTTTFPRKPSASSGGELSQAFAPPRDGKRPSDGNEIPWPSVGAISGRPRRGCPCHSSSAQRVSAVTATPPSLCASARHARSPSESPADRVTCQRSAAARASPMSNAWSRTPSASRSTSRPSVSMPCCSAFWITSETFTVDISASSNAASTTSAPGSS